MKVSSEAAEAISLVRSLDLFDVRYSNTQDLVQDITQMLLGNKNAEQDDS